MKTEYSPFIVTFRYKNATAAIEWLCNVFRFIQKAFHMDDDGSIANAQLVLNNAMIMIASEGENECDHQVKHPQDVEGYNTASPYIIVENIESNYQKRVQNGAVICLPLTIQDYGGGGYTCKDIEGYL